MGINVTLQSMLFLYALLLGVSFGILYDILKCIRLLTHCGQWRTVFLDLLFALVVTSTMYLFFLTAAKGEGRWNLLLAAGIGGCIYLATLSPFLCFLILRIAKSFTILFQKIGSISGGFSTRIKNLKKNMKN